MSRLWTRIGIALACATPAASASGEPPAKADDATAPPRIKARPQPPQRFDLSKLKGRLKERLQPGLTTGGPVSITERAALERRRASLEAQRYFGDRQIPAAYFQEKKRYAERVAKIERIIAVATEVDDAKTAKRAKEFLSEERRRHQAWVDDFVRRVKKPHEGRKEITE